MNSGQYPVQMTRKPMQERGLKGVKNPKTPLGEPATGPSSSFRKSVSIYPRSPPELISFLENATLFLVQTLWFLYLPQNNYLKAIPFTEAYRYSQFITVSPLPPPHLLRLYHYLHFWDKSLRCTSKSGIKPEQRMLHFLPAKFHKQ